MFNFTVNNGAPSNGIDVYINGVFSERVITASSGIFTSANTYTLTNESIEFIFN